MQPLSGPAQTQTTDMLYARAVGEHRHAAFGYAGGRAAGTASGFHYSAFQFHRRFVAVSPSLFLSSHTFSSPTHSLPRSLIPSSCRIRRARPTEITTREIACEMVKQIHNLVLTRSHAKEAFGFRIIGGKEQGLTFKVRRLHMMLIFL